MGYRLAGHSFAEMLASLRIGQDATNSPTLTSGSGVPTLAWPIGSLYMDTSQVKLYQNTDGTAAGWTPVTNPGAVAGDELGISAAFGASQNNYAPAGYAGQSTLLLTNQTAGGTGFTGLNLGAYQVLGKTITVMQGGANAISFLAENTNSTAANRFYTNRATAGQFTTWTFRYTAFPGGNRWLQIG